MTGALAHLLDLLDLEPIEVNIFRGSNTDEVRQRVFGGQVAGQALVAAGRTVDRGRVHSLHSYFLRPGDPAVPILYEVDRIRDGRSFLTRRVVAIQHGRAIFNMQCSFHADEPGIEHQFPMPPAPDPETLPTVEERLEPLRGKIDDEWLFNRPRPIDQRFVGEMAWVSGGEPKEPRQQVWLRTNGKMPNDPLLHAAVITYASDMTLYDSILRPHRLSWHEDQFMGASLDHCIWFHRDCRADDWLLFDQDSPVATGARGLARGLLFARSGDLVATFVQEGLVRLTRRDEPESAVAPSSSSVQARAGGVGEP